MITVEWLKALRKDLGVTQTELAQSLDTAVSTVARWETGVFRPSKPAAKELLKLAEQARKHSSVFGPETGQTVTRQDVPHESHGQRREGEHEPSKPGKPPAQP